jgi:hypothetical protein
LDTVRAKGKGGVRWTWPFWVILLTAVGSRAPLGALARSLTSFDISLLGLTATPDPLEPVLPKNTESAVRIVVRSGDRTLTSAEAASYLGTTFDVKAELSGPGLDRAITVPQLGPSAPPPEDPLLLRFPPLPVAGDYKLSNIRIVHRTTKKPLLDVTPSQIPVKVIDQVLVTSVTTRPLTLAEIQERGIVLDSSSYVGFEFTLGVQTESQSTSFTLPVVFDSHGVPVPSVITPPNAPPRSGVNVSNDQPEPLIVPALLEIDEEKIDLPDIEQVLRTAGGAPIRIPSILVIPGNVGYLKQHFSAMLFVANGAPVGSGLTVKDVSGTVKLPAGADLVLGTADDPLSLPDTVRGPQLKTQAVRAVGPDSVAGTGDDVVVLKPAEQGQAEFLIRGEKEGFHNLDFDINATLEGLPIGPIPIKGSAKGGVLVRNPFFNMTFTMPSAVRKGETFPVFVTVTNIGQSLANDLHVTLDASRSAGATLVGNSTLTIDTLKPRDARTLEFRFVSQRTGQAVATYLNLDTSGGSTGTLKFSLGVGERGVPLSPDTLVLPTAVDLLPVSVTEAAMRVLGQAWSISNAPTGTLPADVIRVSRTVTTQKALALAEAGLRVKLGQNAKDAVRDLAFDFWGGQPVDAGFDQLLRETQAGQGLGRAIGAELAASLSSASGILPFASQVDEVAVSGPDFIGLAVGQGTGAAPVTVALVAANGDRTAAPTSADLPAAEIPGAVWLPLGPTPAAPLLGLLTAATAPTYNLQLTGTGSGTVDIAITQPSGSGDFVRGALSGLAVSAGSQARLTIDRRAPETLVLSLDEDGDGTYESSQPLPIEHLAAPGPSLISATMIGPETVDGSSPFGFHVAALFDRVVDPATAAAAGNYGIPKNFLQNARRQLSGRIVFGTLDQPEGAYLPSTFTAGGVRDPRGATGPSKTVSLTSLLQDPGAVVSGRVVGADGTPVTGAIVTYQNNAEWWCPEEISAGQVGFAAVPLDAQGRYEFRYVRQDKCGLPWAILVKDPRTGALRRATGFVRAAGEQIVLDIALVGQGSVTGVVRDLTNQVVPGAQVAVVSQTDPQVGGVATTDGDGRYVVYGITVGQVTVRAAKGTGVGQTSGNIPRAGSTAEIDVTLDSSTASVAGKVLVVEGSKTSAVPGMQVVFEAQGTPVAVTATDQAGRYSFHDVPAGPFKVKVVMNSRDHAETAGVVAAGDALANIDLVIYVPSSDGTPTPGQGYGTVKGTVRSADGTVAPGVVVSIGDRGVLSDQNGKFEIPGVPVRPNQAQAVVARSRDGLRSGSAVAVVNVAGQIVDNVAIALSGLGSAEFLVVNAGGAPVVGQEVGLLDRCPAACGCNGKITGPDGKVRFDELPLGTVHVRAVRAGIGFADVADGSASIIRDGQIATATLRFGGAGVVKGTVVDPQGHPAFGADVTLQSLTFNPQSCSLSGNVSQRVRTNSLGVYRFQSVNVGAVSVTASQSFFPNSVTRGGALTDEGQELTLDLTLNEGVSTIAGELSGTIFLPDGTTPAGAQIEVTASGPLPDVVVNTDEHGQYHFAKIFSEGSYTVTVRDPITGGVARSSVYLRAGQDQALDMRLLGRGAVLVRVVDAADAPVSSGFVRLRETGFPGRLFEGAVDAAHQGVVTFENVFEGSLAAEASDEFGRGGRASSVLGGPGAILEMKVRLSMTGTVTGIFVAADGETPVPFGAIALTAGGRVIGQTTTQGSGPDVGRFSFDYVPAGPVRVDGQDPGTARTGFAVGTITSQGQVVELKVRSQGLGTVEGIVTSNGVEQPGAEVDLVAGGWRASTTADSTGKYRVTGVPEGQVVATANLGGGFLSGTASANLVGDGTTLILDVALRGSGKVAGRVVKADGVTPSLPAVVRIVVGGTGGGSFSSITDGEGRFTFERVPAGVATLNADVLGSVDRGALTAEVLPAGTTEVTIKLHGVGQLHGVALDSSDHPTKGTVVISGTGDIPYSLTVAVGNDGAFAFPEVLAGPFTASLTVQTTTFTLYGSATGTVLPAQDNAVTIRLQPSGLVRGRVLRANGLTPAAGAEVTVQLLPGRGTLILYAQDDGAFELKGVPLGPFAVGIKDPFSGGAALVEGQNLTSNGQTVDIGDVIIDDTPVAVVSFSPAEGAMQVAIDQAIQVVFSDPLASAQGVVVTAGGGPLPAFATLSTDRRTVTLQGVWPDAREITVTATTAVTDIHGRRLMQPVSSHFRTEDLTPPQVATIAPADQSIEVPADTSVVVTFDEALDPGANAAGVVSLARAGSSVGGTVARTGEAQVTFTPNASLVGDATFTVTVNGARDVSGNLQTAVFTSSFKTHDSQPPLLALVQPPPGTWIKERRPAIVVALSDGLSGVEASTGLLAIDGSAVQPGRSAVALSYTPPAPLGEGSHTLTASVADRAGNVGTLVAAVNVDTQPPGPAEITGVAGGAVLTGSVAIGATAADALSGVHEIRVYVDGTQLLALPVPSFQATFDSNGLPEGPHVLTARAVDQAGNLGPAGAAVAVIVDNHAIVVTITTPVVGTRVRDSLVAKATVSEPVKQVVFTVGAVSVSDESAPYEVTLAIAGEAEGAATLVATATGLRDETGAASRGFAIDRTPPPPPNVNLVFAEPPDNGKSLVYGQNGAVEVGARVDLTNVNTGAIATTLASATGSFGTLLSAAVGHTVSLVAVDVAGNASAPATVTVRSQTTLPPLVATLRYDGLVVDRVGLGPSALAPDGNLDAVFELGLNLGTGITRQLSFIELVGPSTRSTRLEEGAVLGVSAAADLAAPWLNHADGTIDTSLTAGVSLLLFASADGFIQPGATYTVTALFTNGSRFVGSVVVPVTPPNDLASASFSVLNQSSDVDPGQPPASGDVAGAMFSVVNQSLPPEIDPSPVATNDLSSEVFAVVNQSLPPELDPAPLAGGDLSTPMFSVSNQSLPPGFDPAPLDTGDLATGVFSVSNQAIPGELNPEPTEVVSPVVSAKNEVLPFSAAQIAEASEAAGAVVSVRNDLTPPPDGGIVDAAP